MAVLSGMTILILQKYYFRQQKNNSCVFIKTKGSFDEYTK